MEQTNIFHKDRTELLSGHSKREDRFYKSCGICEMRGKDLKLEETELKIMAILLGQFSLIKVNLLLCEICRNRYLKNI